METDTHTQTYFWCLEVTKSIDFLFVHLDLRNHSVGPPLNQKPVRAQKNYRFIT